MGKWSSDRDDADYWKWDSKKCLCRVIRSAALNSVKLKSSQIKSALKSLYDWPKSVCPSSCPAADDQTLAVEVSVMLSLFGPCEEAADQCLCWSCFLSVVHIYTRAVLRIQRIQYTVHLNYLCSGDNMFECYEPTHPHTYVTRDLYLANPFFLKRLFNAVIT